MATLDTKKPLLTDASGPDDVTGNRFRQLIGWIGLVFGGIIILLARDRDGAGYTAQLTSISAYYYSGAVWAFTGMLVSLGLFLFAYKGYKNDYWWADQLASKLAAAAAIVVAWYPTKAPTPELRPEWWSEEMGIYHHIAAGILFTMFAIFALFLFPLSAKTAHKKSQYRLKELEDQERMLDQGTRDKRERETKLKNAIYYVCGGLILIAIGWALWAGKHGDPIFLPECIALGAFSLSWLVKGTVHHPIRAWRS